MNADNLWWEPDWRVWDRLHMARFFTLLAQAEPERMPRMWCLNIVAEALWSAVDIFNRHVAEQQSKLGPKTTAWFKANEPLVHFIRNGAVHYAQPTGLGVVVTSGADDDAPTVEPTVWIMLGGKHENTPLGEVVSRLTAVRLSIEKQVLMVTGERL